MVGVVDVGAKGDVVGVVVVDVGLVNVSDSVIVPSPSFITRDFLFENSPLI